MKKNKWLRLFSTVMALVIIIASLPLIANAEETTVHFGVFSDAHFFADSLKGDNRQAYKDFTIAKSKEYTENYSLVNNALDGILRNAEMDGADYLLIPGDMTKDGEYESHVALAKILEDWQAKTGIPVFVTNGNHDVNNSNACTFVNGVKEEGRKTTPEEFREIYKNLGFDKADAFFTPKGYSKDYDGIKGGMLSYAADLGDAYRLIVVDTSIYSVDNGAKETEHLTDGQVGDDLLKWVVAQANEATAKGKTPLVMQHHNLVPHMDIEEATFWAFVCWDWERIADTYADAGIHYVFTGHLHASDTSAYVSDNGEEITDILSPTLTGYPNYFRTMDITTDGKNTTLEMVNHDIDEYQPVVSEDGKEYPKPYKYTASMDQTFGNDIGDFAERTIGNLIYDYFGQIQEAGGIINFLTFMGIDVEKLLIDLIGTNGLAVGKANILTVSGNAMSFIRDLDSQIMANYVSDPKGTMDKLMSLIDKLLNMQVSSYPCTLNAELLGKEYYTGKPCTLGEYATSALLLYYGGDENCYGEPGYEYLEDTIKKFYTGENAELVFTTLIDVLLNDLIEDELLANLDFNVDALFPQGTAFFITAKLIQKIIETALGGNNSYLNLINSVLGLSVVPEGYNSINDILDTLLLKKYLTKSQYVAWGATMGWMIKSLIFDENPEKKGDNNITVTYSGKKPVEATQENYRLPSNVVMNLTDDNTTSVTITWATKYSITDTDIELIDYSANPQFSGKATKSKNIVSSYESTHRSYPGANFGFIGFFDLSKEYIKHVITLKDLEPGKKYSYRVGSEKYGWWSEAGTITMSGGDKEAFTFIGITDPQAQCESQYETYAGVMKAATALYSDARFTVSSGDQVDLGTTSKQWSYFFNSTNTFMNMPFMPATGNHEDDGAVLKENFTLPGVPKQDETTGTYYSYDYNGVHFTVLNTNDLDDDKDLSDAQINWLKEDIKGSNARWKVVILHKALYANGIYYKDKETVALRQQLSVLLPSLGVDLVLQGHNHVYTRTDVMKANCVVPCNTETVKYNGQEYKMKVNPNGTIYSIVNSSSVKEYTMANQKDCDKYYPTAECVVDNEYPMFAAITVDGDNLYYSAYQVKDGKAELADSFGIKKDGDPTKNIFDKLMEFILGKLNIKYTWKIGNFFLRIFAPVIKLISRV